VTSTSSLSVARDARKEREKKSDATKVVDVATIREEITKLFDRCTGLEYELQTAKAQRSETEVLETQLEEKTKLQEEQFELQAQRAGDLESKIGLMKSELTTLRLEKTDLFEKYRKSVEESLPALDNIDRELRDSQEAVNRLHADAETLASMFRIQVDDNTKHKADRERMLNELRRANRQLKRERDEGQFKDEELQKKETLHRCTVEARQTILDEYAALKETAREVEAAAQRQELELQGIQELVGTRDETIQELRRKLQEAHVGVDYCERQKKFCLQQFQTAVGRPYSMLLEQYKPKAKC
jgi:DNA repair exonuclease SbcCD ATPase subunit